MDIETRARDLASDLFCDYERLITGGCLPRVQEALESFVAERINSALQAVRDEALDEVAKHIEDKYDLLGDELQIAQSIRSFIKKHSDPSTALERIAKLEAQNNRMREALERVVDKCSLNSENWCDTYACIGDEAQQALSTEES